MIEAPSLLPQEQEGQQGTADTALLPVPDNTPTARVPRNAEEVAAQLTLALGNGARGSDFADAYRRNLSAVKSGAAEPMLSQVLDQELQSRLAATKQTVADFAAAQDVENATSAARMAAAQEAEAAKATAANSPVDAQVAATTRALETQGIDYAARVYKNMGEFGRRLDDAAGDAAVRNILAQGGSEADAQTDHPIWDGAAHFFGSFIPFMYGVIADRNVAKITGESHPFNANARAESLRTYLLGLQPPERSAVVASLLKDDFGIFGDNASAKADFFRQMAEMTQSDSNVQFATDLANLTVVADGAALAKGVWGLVRKGAPIKVLADVAGEQKAGQLLGDELVNKTGTLGVNDADAVSRVLSGGHLPYAQDPAATDGLSAAAQEQLKSRWDTMVAAVQDRLNSAALTPEEVAQGNAAIRANYMPETNKEVHSVIFGEASVDGQKMTLYWQSPDGRAFMSKEAAEAAAVEKGLPASAVVPKNTVGAEFDALHAETEEAPLLMARGKGGSQVKIGSSPLDELAGKSGPELDSAFEDIFGPADDFVGQNLVDLFKRQAERSQKFVAATSILKVIASDSTDEGERFLADYLLRSKTNWEKVDVTVNYLEPRMEGGYLYTTDKVHVATHSAQVPEVYLHELIHAHNSQVVELALNSPKKAAEILSKDQIKASHELKDLNDKLREWLFRQDDAARAKHGSLYDVLGRDAMKALGNATEHPEELVTYGLTKQSTMAMLQKIKLSELGYEGNEATVMSKLWDIFRRVLGLRANDTALAKVTDIFERLAETGTEDTRTVLKDLVGKGQLSKEQIAGWRMESSAASPVRQSKKGLTRDEARQALLDAEAELTKAKRGYTGKSDEPSPTIDAASRKVREASAAYQQAVREDEALMRRGRGDVLNSERNASFVKVAGKPHIKGKVGATGEWLVREERHDPLSYESIGKFTDKDIESMPTIAIDPKHGASEIGVEARVVGVHAEAKTKQALVSFIKPYFDKLDRQGAARVESLLEEGDRFSNGGSFGKEFSYGEARAKGLSDDEAQAYLATRSLRMAMFHIRNGEMVRHLRAQGLREIEVAGTKTVGRSVDLEGAGRYADKWVHDLAQGKDVKLTASEMADAYATGKRVVKLEHPVEIKGELRQTLLADRTLAKERDVTQALHYRPGEYSRIYTDQYFIRLARKVKVDGEDQILNETIRTAPSDREAQAFIKSVRGGIDVLKNSGTDRELEKVVGQHFKPEEFRAAYEKGDFKGLQSIESHFTRNREEYLNGSVGEALANGRLFTSKRGERVYSTDATRKNTLPVFQSLEAEMTNVSRVANVNQWRETMVRKWMNTFGDMLPKRTGNDVQDFYDAAGAKFTRAGKDALFAERTHKYIMRQIGQRTAEEQFYQTLTRRMTERFFKGGEKIESVGAKIRQAGLLSFIRSANFNLTLGMFNPAQLIVQANGAATAVALSPLHGLAAARTVPLLRMALMSDNPKVWNFFGSIDKALLGKDDFAKLVKAVRQTGILDNLKSTSLYNMEDGKLNVFKSYTDVMAMGNAPFNRGEEFSRLVSFDVARREWIAAHPGANWTTKQALGQMVVRMDDFTQNMTKANLARFQEGALAIPLQFAQYNIKLAANVMSSLLGKGEGRGFTKREALQLMLAHVLLYGAAGNGLVGLANEVLPEKTKNTLSVDQKTYISQGLLAGLVNQFGEWATGERTDVALGSRLGSFNYYQQLFDALIHNPKDIYNTLLGPTVSSAKRLGTIGEAAYLMYKNPDLTARDVLEGLSHISTEQISTLRNVTKAYLYHTHADKMVDAKGINVAQLTPNEVLAQALGFQPTAAVDVNDAINSKKAHEQALKDIADHIIKVQKDIMTARLRGDHQYADHQHALLQALWPDNSGDLWEVQRLIREHIYPYDTEMQRLGGEYLWKGQTYDKAMTTTTQSRGQQ